MDKLTASKAALIVTLALVAVPVPVGRADSAHPLIERLVARSIHSPSVDDEPEYAPILERNMDFYDFSLKSVEGKRFNLRDYAAGKRLVIVGFVAGWCKNSNHNGHVIKRLYDKYKDKGLGVVVVAEYSTDEEIRMHINRIGIDYPVVIETTSLSQRKKSQHYRYRHSVGDSRKWGTPFYIIVDARDVEPRSEKAPLARHVYTVSGEIIEDEAEQFIKQRIGETN